MPGGALEFSDVSFPKTTAALNAYVVSEAAVGELAALLALGETEPNDTIATAEPLSLGFEFGENDAIDVFGSLGEVVSPTEIVPSEDDGSIPLANATGLAPRTSAIASGTIGDGPFGQSSGDFDFYSVAASAGARITVDVNARSIGSPLDSVVAIYDSGGTFLDGDDDSDGSSDSLLRFTAPADDVYYIVVTGFGAGLPRDAMDSSSGLRAGSTGPYEVVIGLSTEDVDFFSVELEAGDILGASGDGSATRLTLLGDSGAVLLESTRNRSSFYPAVSPLLTDGNAALARVIEATGRYTIGVDGGLGQYELSLRLFRPEFESQRRREHQILFLDFDGQTIDSSNFGSPGTRTLSPLSVFLDGWGLGGDDESAVIDAILAVVQENFSDVGLLGNNGDFFVDGGDGHYGLEILNSRDHDDPFGQRNVSRVVVGGTREELGVPLIGVAESTDVGNFLAEETAVVMLDLLSGSGPDSLNRFTLGSGATTIDLVGVGVGNFVSHEAGHLFGAFHTLQGGFNIMDQGGSLPNIVGVGPNEIFENGGGDDIDVDFGRDTYVPADGFTGIQDTLNTVAFGLATGLVDPGMVVTGSTPAAGEFILSRPTRFVIEFFDPYDPASATASDLTVNGIPADSLLLTDSNTLTFQFAQSPVTSDGPQAMAITAGAMTRAGDGQPVESYSATFSYDSLLLDVATIEPAAGAIVQPPLASVLVHFNEPVDPASVDVGDLVLSRGRVTGLSLVDTATVQFQLAELDGEGPLTLEIPAGALSDMFGNPGDAFATTLELDVSRAPFPVPLKAAAPLGSLVYESSLSAFVNIPGDRDRFTLRIDPGQTITLVVDPVAQLEVFVELRDAGGTRLASAAGEAGERVLIQTVAIDGRLASRTRLVGNQRAASAGGENGSYVVTIGGLSQTTGGYTLRLLLNAAAEDESNGGSQGGEPFAAQDLESAFIPLFGSLDDDHEETRPERGAVVSQTDLAQRHSASQTRDEGVFFPFVLDFDFTELPPPRAGGVLRVSAVADLDGKDAFLTLDAEGLFTRDLFVSDGLEQQQVAAEINLTQAELVALAADGTISFSLTASGVVRRLGPNEVTLELSYPVGEPPVDRYRFTLEADQTATLALAALSEGDVDLRLLDPSGAPLALGIEFGEGGDEAIANFIAPAGGVYFAEVSGDAHLDYNLVVTRGADLSLDDNSGLDSASELLAPRVAGRQWVLGHLGEQADDDTSVANDFYRVTLGKGQPLDVQALSPASGPGEPVNRLVPLIRLYDAAGNLVATDDRTAPGGQGTRLKFKPSKDALGDYFIEIAPSGETAQPPGGEYILAVKGATLEPPPFEVTGTDPPDGLRTAEPPTQITVDFSDAVLLTSLAPSDLTVNGVPATGVVVLDGDTALFHLPPLVEGVNQIAIGGGAIQNLQAAPIGPFTSTLIIDTTGPRVIASSVLTGDLVPAGTLVYTARFDEPLDDSRLDASDVRLSGQLSGSHQPVQFHYDATTFTLTLQYAGLAEDVYTLILPSGRFADLLGNTLDGEAHLATTVPSGDGQPGGSFVVNFSGDIDQAPFPVPLTKRRPLGSLIGETAVTATIGTAGDTDRFTLDVDPNQTITVIVEPNEGLQPRVSVQGPSVSGPSVTVDAPAAGHQAILQMFPAAEAGTYTVTVDSVGGTTGIYTARLILNAAVEKEQYNGPTNDTPADAQDLDANLPAPALGPAERRAVLGSLPAGPVASVDWYRFELLDGQSASAAMRLSGPADVGLDIYDDQLNLLTIGVPAADLDQAVNNFVDTTTNLVPDTYLLRVSGSDVDYRLVVVRNAEFDVEPNSDRTTAQDITLSGQALGHVGVTGTSVEEDLAQVENGSRVSGPNTVSGLLITRKSFTLQPQSLFRTLVIVTNPGPSPANHIVSLNVGAAPVVVGTASGDTFFTPEDNWIVTDITNEVTGESAMLQVIAGPGGQLPSAVFASDSGRTFSYSYDLTLAPGETKIVMHFFSLRESQAAMLAKGPQLASLGLGALAGMTDEERAAVVNFVAGAPEDNYRVEARAGDLLTITTSTPSSDPGQGVNNLDLRVELFDPLGGLVAIGAAGSLVHEATVAGPYTVRILAENHTFGEYSLIVSGHTGPLPAFEVAGIDPTDGAFLPEVPTQVTVDFGRAVHFDTLAASDLTVDGLPALAVSVVDARRAAFELPALGPGVHHLSIAAGALVDIQGTPIESFNGTYTVDLVAPRVIASSLAEGDVVPSGTLTYTARFDEPLRGAQLDASDVALVGMAVGRVEPALLEYDPTSSTLTLQFVGLPDDAYTLSLLSGEGGFQDLAGNDLDGEREPATTVPSGDGDIGGDFVVNFLADATVATFPTPFEATRPLGSLIYEQTTSGRIEPAGDADSYTLQLDGGQTVTVVVQPEAGLVVNVTLDGPTQNPLSVTSTVSAAGQEVFLQTVPTGGGTYTVTVAGDGATQGGYTLRIILNAAVEVETHGGTDNSTPATAQDLDSSFIPLIHASDGAAIASAGQRAAVLGRTDTNDDFSAGRTFRNRTSFGFTLPFNFGNAPHPRATGWSVCQPSPIWERTMSSWPSEARASILGTCFNSTVPTTSESPPSSP